MMNLPSSFSTRFHMGDAMQEVQKVHMDPNSDHQLWSKWTFLVTPPLRQQLNAFPRRTLKHKRPFEEVKLNVGRFTNKLFGNTGQGNLQQLRNGQWRYICRVEGAPVHDPAYVKFTKDQWTKFFIAGFGNGTTVSIDAKLEAGDAQNGKPRDQLIILPQLQIGVN